MASEEGDANIVDWDAVENMVDHLSKVSVAQCRVELTSIDEKINAEKKKLKTLCIKHAQACEELARVRKSVQKEREMLMESFNKVEQDLAVLSDKESTNDNVIQRNQLKVELAQIQKKIETKKQDHEQYINTHMQTMRKRERLCQVQAKTVRNLLHRKLALGEKTHLSSSNTNEREEVEGENDRPVEIGKTKFAAYLDEQKPSSSKGKKNKKRTKKSAK